MSNNENKPIILKAILWVFPCTAIFFLTRTLLVLLISLLGFIISKIPILGTFLNLLFVQRGDTLFSFATIISIFTAYFITTFTQEKMMKDASTNALSRRILGVIIALNHLLSLIANISEGGYYSTNIFCIIASLAFVFCNKDVY